MSIITILLLTCVSFRYGRNILNDRMICRFASTWYRIPLKAQKLLLFMILRSSMDCELRLSGLFTPSYAGLTSVISLFSFLCNMILNFNTFNYLHCRWWVRPSPIVPLYTRFNKYSRILLEFYFSISIAVIWCCYTHRFE